MESTLYDVDDNEGDEDNAAGEVEDAETNTPARQDIDVYTYCPMHVMRPVLPCLGERKITQAMYKCIASFPNRQGLFFKDAVFIFRNNSCPSNGTPFDTDDVQLVVRSGVVTLLTLEAGPLGIRA